MALINPAVPSGPYSATWGSSGGVVGSALDIGLFEGPTRLQQSLIALPIRASQWGQTIIDYVVQGGGFYGVMVLKEWTANTKKFLWPFGLNVSYAQGVVEEPGKMLSGYCDQLILTALSGTPAATYGPVTRTYDYVCVLPGHNIDQAFGPVERNIVVAFVALPQPNSGGSRKAKFFVDT